MRARTLIDFATDWLRELVRYPAGAAGLLTTGGSISNLIAVYTARREKLGDDFTRGVIYAKVEHPTGPVHAFCTHIAESGTAKFTYPGYEHLTGSEDENAQHIQWALEFIEERCRSAGVRV